MSKDSNVQKPDLLFEVSWEVCNKVGGIYTVVKSKAARMAEQFDQYILVGPYNSEHHSPEFHEEIPPEDMQAVCDKLKEQGIIVHFGTWLIEGKPNVILLDVSTMRSKTNDIKRLLWEWYALDTLHSGFDFDEPIVWAFATGMLIQELAQLYPDKKTTAQFHEWLSGAGLLYLKKYKVNVGTVFTTHATILGRTLASSNVDLYNVWDKINPEEHAYKYGIQSKYLLEKNCAHNADIFTTVSEITGMEAEHLLGKKPDVLLPNGLDIAKFPSFEDTSVKHQMLREKTREFMISYFFPYYTFDLSQTLTYFIVGRYEFHDKGIDVFIRALGNLNQKLKEMNSKKTIVAFIWVPAHVRNIKHEVLENKTFFNDIKEALEDNTKQMQRKIMHALIGQEEIASEKIFENEFLVQLKARISRFKRKGTPPLCTHDLHEPNDIILQTLRENGLHNTQEDKVKVINYPIYLTGADSLLDLNYYESMQGAHLGIFPSYYEPWGYTPLEAGALGVPSVTSDLAGFGRYFCSDCTQEKYPGISVLRRLNKSDDDVVDQLTKIMVSFSQFSSQERTASKIEARKITSTADWKYFIKHYVEAHGKAAEKKFG